MSNLGKELILNLIFVLQLKERMIISLKYCIKYNQKLYKITILILKKLIITFSYQLFVVYQYISMNNFDFLIGSKLKI